MKKNVAGQLVSFEAYNITTGARVTGDAANITPYCQIDSGAYNALSTTTITEWAIAKSGIGLYYMQPSQTETNGSAITYLAISSTPNVLCRPQFITTVPPGFDIFLDAAGALTNPVAVFFNTDKTGYSLAAGGLTGTSYVPPTTALSESYSALHANPSQAQLLFEIRSLLAEKSVTGTVMTVNKIDGVTPAMTFTLSSATSPTSITRTT